MMKGLQSNDYVIAVGGSSTSYCEQTHILHVECNDNYEGLPEKVVKAFTFVHDDGRFSKYTHVCKIDEDIIIHKLVTAEMLSDYCGAIENRYIGNRRWHIGKCSKDSIFNTTEYKGIYVPWCLGGNGYFVSRKALGLVVADTDYKNEIYEDLYIAKILRRNTILPTQIRNLSTYLFSKDHS